MIPVGRPLGTLLHAEKCYTWRQWPGLWLWLHPFLCGLTTVRKLQRGWDLLYLPRWGLFLRLPMFQAVSRFVCGETWGWLWPFLMLGLNCC